MFGRNVRPCSNLCTGIGLTCTYNFYTLLGNDESAWTLNLVPPFSALSCYGRIKYLDTPGRVASCTSLAARLHPLTKSVRIKSGCEHVDGCPAKLALSISEVPNLSFRYVLQLLQGLVPPSRQLLPVPGLEVPTHHYVTLIFRTQGSSCLRACLGTGRKHRTSMRSFDDLRM